MPWQQLHIATVSEQAELISERLDELGALSITFLDSADQPLFQIADEDTALWDKTTIVALFAIDMNLQRIIKQLQQQYTAEPAIHYWITTIADQAWENCWQDEIKPLRFGKNLWVCPSHAKPPTAQRQSPQQDKPVIVSLDPGLAFGTGTHPTTQMCLEYLANHPPIDQTVIDYGCGSGILSLAALKLGAKIVHAIDIDSQALQATKDNAIKNTCDLKQIHITMPDEIAKIKADLLLANILANPLMELADKFAKLIRSGGQIVLSGLLREQLPIIISHYSRWFTMNKPRYLDEWGCVVGIRC